MVRVMVTLLLGAGVANLFVIAPRFLGAIGYDKRQIGVVMGAFNLASLAMAPVVARLIARLGFARGDRRRLRAGGDRRRGVRAGRHAGRLRDGARDPGRGHGVPDDRRGRPTSPRRRRSIAWRRRWARPAC
jgi:hypothetical protein